MKLPRLGKWLFVVAILLTLGVVFASYLVKPLQSPHVSLQFQGFKPGRTKIMALTCETNYGGEVRCSADGMWVRLGFEGFPTSQTNSLAIICMTNHGPSRVWWNGIGWAVEAKTPSGWITNEAVHLSWSDYSVAPSSNDVFGVRVPGEAIEWRVRCWYRYFKRHHVRLELAAWLWERGLFSREPPKLLVYPLNAVGWAMRQLPEPREQDGEVCSAFFTNKPPTDLLPSIRGDQ